MSKFSLFCLSFSLFCLTISTKIQAEVQFIADTELSKLVAIEPAKELDTSFFPSYLHTALKNYKSVNYQACLISLEKINLNAYSLEPEKYYLLKALCTKTESPETQLAAIEELAKKSSSEKGSSSDVLFALGLAFASHNINDKALQSLQDAGWFKNFNKISQAKYFYALGRVQMMLGMYGEANTSILEAQKKGLKETKLDFLILELKILLGDRKAAISQASSLKNCTTDVSDSYRLRSLMLLADPIFHKKDIQTAADIAAKLGKKNNENKQLAIPAIKAALLVKDFILAREISAMAAAKDPSDPLLASLKKQAFEEQAALEETSPN